LVKLLPWKKARLGGYALVFNVYSRSRNGGVANIELRDGEFVKGVIFEVKEEDIPKLDEKEGSPLFYEQVPIKHGDKRIWGDVFTYAVPSERTKPYHVKPIKDYINVIINGARKYGLSEEWLKKLANVPTQD